jgi:hypothetical protein
VPDRRFQGTPTVIFKTATVLIFSGCFSFSEDKDSMRHRIGLGFLWLFLLSVTAHAQNQNPFDAFQQFSASVSGGPLKWDKLKIYRSGKQIRAEYVYENEIRISNLGDRKGWYIRPREWKTKPKECGRMTLMDMSSYPFFAYSSSDFNVERAAEKDTPEKETIDGHSCKVQDYTVTAKDGGQPIKVKLWEAEDLNGFPVRIQVEPPSKAKFVLNYTDVSVKPPDPKLFQLPAMCRVGAQGKGKKKAAATAPKTPSKVAPKLK